MSQQYDKLVNKQNFSARDFRNAMGKFATGVTIVTAHHNGGDLGVTINSFSSVSLDPPLVLFSLKRDAGCFDVFSKTDYVTINILSDEQQEISNIFAKSYENNICPYWQNLSQGLMRGKHTNTPHIAGSLCHIDCKRYANYDGGDHVIMLWQVLDITMREGSAQPLLYYEGSYRRIREGKIDEK